MSFQLRFPDKLKTTLQLKGISGLNGEFIALGSGAEALEEGCFAVVVVEGIGREEAGMQAGSHEFLAQDRVIWGKPAAQAVVEDADRRGAKRVFIVTSRTLNRTTDAVAGIAAALGARHVGTRRGP